MPSLSLTRGNYNKLIGSMRNSISHFVWWNAWARTFQLSLWIQA